MPRVMGTMRSERISRSGSTASTPARTRPSSSSRDIAAAACRAEPVLASIIEPVAAQPVAEMYDRPLDGDANGRGEREADQDREHEGRGRIELQRSDDQDHRGMHEVDGISEIAEPL